MAMLPSAIRSSILALTLLVSAGVCAERGALKADGIIRVKGADVFGTTVTVVPGNAASYSLFVDARHITLDLPLDDVYLVSVRREGCPTKEVYFDTRVPVEMHASTFDFPFQITLERLSAERMFAYAAPVGFVRYAHTLKDFSYETQYVIRVEEELKQRMKEIQETGVDPKMIGEVAQARVVDRPRGEYSASLGSSVEESNGTLAPNVREVPRLVHVLSASTPTAPAEPRAEEGVQRLFPVPVEVATAELPIRVPVRVALAPITTTTRAVAQQAAPKMNTAMVPSQSEVRVVPSASNTTFHKPARTEELITEPRRVTRIVRFTAPTGAVQEYRMVRHAFGGVYYFQDSRSITERDFAQGVAE